MRSTLIALALGSALTFGAAALAQDTPPPQRQDQWGTGGPGRMNPDQQLEHLTKILNLTADQQAQIKPVLADRQQKMHALFQDESLSQEDRRAKAQSIRQDTQGKIEAVLNDQQKQKFEAMQEHMHHGGGPESPQGTAPQPQP